MGHTTHGFKIYIYDGGSARFPSHFILAINTTLSKKQDFAAVLEASFLYIYLVKTFSSPHFVMRFGLSSFLLKSKMLIY
jgi:hypothetical protein